MATIQNDAVIIDKDTSKLQAFRLEDTERAPVIIVYVDENPAEMVALAPKQTPPTKIKSRNMEEAIQIISYEEVYAAMGQGEDTAEQPEKKS